jgi:hypothetical protein
MVKTEIGTARLGKKNVTDEWCGVKPMKFNSYIDLSTEMSLKKFKKKL